MNQWNYGMAVKTSFVRFLLLGVLMAGAGNAMAQDELRRTFFRDADAAKQAADAQDARLLAPSSYEDGMEDYQDAEEALQRGRNIEFVRRKAGEAEENFRTAAKAAELAHTALSQVLKSRQGCRERACAGARTRDLGTGTARIRECDSLSRTWRPETRQGE